MKILLSFVFSTLLASGVFVACETTDHTTVSTVSTTVTTLETTLHPNSTTANTTEVPSTTTTTLSTTTEQSTTTLSSTTQQSTTTVPITTEGPKPTPVPDDCSWNVTDGNLTCIRVEIKALFVIDVQGENFYVALSQNATSEGSSCKLSNDTQLLQLAEHETYTLTVIFREEANKVFVDNITFSYTLPGGKGTFYNDKDKFFPVKAGNSYMCKSHDKIPLGNVTIDIYDIHIQAFGSKDETDFGATEECEADDKVSDAVPIAVGCALAALIVIVLIAYLVGRRQSRQKGYQSV